MEPVLEKPMVKDDAVTLRLLLIDDDRVDRQAIRRLFHKMDLTAEIVECETVESGLRALDNGAFQCVLIDYQMPMQNGLQGIEEIHKKDAYMPVVMLTGKGHEALAVQALHSGAHHYVPKHEVSAISLWDAISTAIETGNLKQKMDQQRQLLENFDNVLVHDLKEPIRSVRGFTELMSEAIANKEYGEVAPHFEYVRRAADHMDSLIDTLKCYSEAGEEHIVLEQISMQTILEDALNNLREVIKERNAHVTHGVLPEIRGNRALLVQLLQNLIGNGLKYCKAETPTIHVSATKQGEGVWQFSVNDNGIGIAASQHKRIFEPFKRLHAAHEYSGTGLGLATCRRIVDHHGGRIWCESQQGDGTSFFFTISS